MDFRFIDEQIAFKEQVPKFSRKGLAPSRRSGLEKEALGSPGGKWAPSVSWV